MQIKQTEEHKRFQAKKQNKKMVTEKEMTQNQEKIKVKCYSLTQYIYIIAETFSNPFETSGDHWKPLTLKKKLMKRRGLQQ